MTLAEARDELAAALVKGEDWAGCPIVPLRLVELEDGYLVAGIDAAKIRKTRALRVALRAFGLEPTWNGKFIMYQQVGHPRHGRRFAHHQLEILDGIIEATP